MKKILFLIGRGYTLLVTWFWAFCCFALIAAAVSWEENTILGLPLWVMIPFIALAAIVGLLNLFYWKEELPLYDRILTLVAPVVLGVEAMHMIRFSHAVEIGLDIPIGFIFFLCGIAVGILFLVNTIRCDRKNAEAIHAKPLTKKARRWLTAAVCVVLVGSALTLVLSSFGHIRASLIQSEAASIGEQAEALRQESTAEEREAYIDLCNRFMYEEHPDDATAKAILLSAIESIDSWESFRYLLNNEDYAPQLPLLAQNMPETVGAILEGTPEPEQLDAVLTLLLSNPEPDFLDLLDENMEANTGFYNENPALSEKAEQTLLRLQEEAQWQRRFSAANQAA